MTQCDVYCLWITSEGETNESLCEDSNPEFFHSLSNEYYNHSVNDRSHSLQRLCREFPSKISLSNSNSKLKRVDCHQFMDYINRLKPYRV